MMDPAWLVAAVSSSSFQLILGALALSVSLLLCLKIKSSKKDPAIMGTEGTIYRIKDQHPQEPDDEERRPHNNGIMISVLGEEGVEIESRRPQDEQLQHCLLYTSDAADE